MVWAATILAFVLVIGIVLNNRSAAGGIEGGRLAACPNKPNCVCSQDTDPQHAIEPISVTKDLPIREVAKVISQMPRTKIIEQTSNYLYVTFRSKVFQFLDDVEFFYIPEQGVIHVRSSSRVGYRDFGVNRERVEMIRQELLDNI